MKILTLLCCVLLLGGCSVKTFPAIGSKKTEDRQTTPHELKISTDTNSFSDSRFSFTFTYPKNLQYFIFENEFFLNPDHTIPTIAFYEGNYAGSNIIISEPANLPPSFDFNGQQIEVSLQQTTNDPLTTLNYRLLRSCELKALIKDKKCVPIPHSGKILVYWERGNLNPDLEKFIRKTSKTGLIEAFFTPDDETKVIKIVDTLIQNFQFKP